MSEGSKRYRAFISYSQKDKAHARRIHQALENYRLPHGIEADGVDAKTRKLGRLFRDDDEMGAATDLGAALRGAIADAENLIVVCSPNAAKSRWVNEEIIHFKRTGRAEQIFAVIVSGEPTPSAEKRDRECFPPALRFELGADGALTDRPTEPLGLDLRRESFNRVVARLAAGLLRTSFDALWQREQRRARVRTATASLAAILILLIVSGAATQNLWRPRLDAYMRYTRFAHSTAELVAAAPRTTFQDCRSGSTDCPMMVVIPEGDVFMGSVLGDPEDGGNESPQRVIPINRFAVSQHEITFANWQRCVVGGGCRGASEPSDAGWGKEDRPIINISWEDAQEYVRWLSRVTGSDYRLLTEAEWEYAARARTSAELPQTRFSWGNVDPVCDPNAPNGAAYGSCEQQRTWPVGSFRANAFGLHDMHGNVWELVEDCYSLYLVTRLESSAVTTDDTTAQSCSFHVARGGAWSFDPAFLRSAYRGGSALGWRSNDQGFRIAKTL